MAEGVDDAADPPTVLISHRPDLSGSGG